MERQWALINALRQLHAPRGIDASGRLRREMFDYEKQLDADNLARAQGSTAGNFLKGAGTGAATGAAIGSAVPVIGTAIGAVGGGLIGGLGSLFMD